MVKRRSDKPSSLHQPQSPTPASAVESDADPFPLAGRRGKTRAECLEIISRFQKAIHAPAADDESETVDVETDHRGDALASHGFPRDWWLPVPLAREWQTDDYPKELTAASVQQWLDLYEKVYRANLGADQLSANCSFRERAEKFRRHTAADCELLKAHLVDLLREAASGQRRGLNAILKMIATRLKSVPPSTQGELPAIIMLGERQYQTPGCQPVTVTDREDSVLQAFREQPTMDEPALGEKSGFEDAVKVLRGLRTKYGGMFGPSIRLPGRKACGGYHVHVDTAP